MLREIGFAMVITGGLCMEAMIIYLYTLPRVRREEIMINQIGMPILDFMRRLGLRK